MAWIVFPKPHVVRQEQAIPIEQQPDSG